MMGGLFVGFVVAWVMQQVAVCNMRFVWSHYLRLVESQQ